MSAVVVHQDGRMTVRQYLDWAERQPGGRYELVDGVPIKMSPERNAHAAVKGAVYGALRDAVRSAALDLVVLPDGPTVVIDEHRSREPDVVVQSGRRLDWNAVTADEPLILVEVTSPSTVRTDTGDKLIEYFSLASVRHYLLVNPTERTVIHHRRDEDGGIRTAIVSSGALRFEPPGFSVGIDRFFEDLPPGKGH